MMHFGGRVRLKSKTPWAFYAKLYFFFHQWEKLCNLLKSNDAVLIFLDMTALLTKLPYLHCNMPMLLYIHYLLLLISF